MHPAELDAAARTRAAQRGGVLTRKDAEALGATSAQVATALRTGRWCTVLVGVHAPVPALPPRGTPARHVLELAAVLRRGAEDVVGVAASAALVHALPLLGTPPRRPETSRSVVREDRVTVGGLVVTGPARTALDVARRGSLHSGVVILDAVLGQGVPRTELERVLDASARVPGSVRARRALSLARCGSESPLETLGRLAMVREGLPEPQLQVDLGGSGRAVRVDHCWRELRTVAEADGASKYRRPSDLYEEKLREDRLRDAGWEVVRYGWDDVVLRPGLLAERVRRAFARARRAA